MTHYNCTVDENIIATIIVGRAITLEREKRSKELIPKKDAKRIKSDNFTRGNREKYNIAIAILEK